MSGTAPGDTGGPGSTGRGEEEPVTGDSEDAMTMVMESLLKAATSTGPSPALAGDGSTSTKEGMVARERSWSTASSVSAADISGKLQQCLGSRYNIIVKNKRDRLIVPDLHGGTTELPFFGSFLHNYDGRTLNTHIRENFRENQIFSLSFDPKSFRCTGCWGKGEEGSGHSLEAKKDEQGSTKSFVATDHCFPPTIFARGGVTA